MPSLYRVIVCGTVLTSLLTTAAYTQSTAKLSRRISAVNTRERRGSSYYEVSFSDAEESVLKASQGETLESLLRMLAGRSIQEIERRCVQLGLRCGQAASPPTKKTEKWRTRARD